MTYVGHLDFFSEQGSEGLSLTFVDSRAKYLSGYEQLDLTYFFKNLDKLFVVVTHEKKELYTGFLTFKYHSSSLGIMPQEIDPKTVQSWINQKATITISGKTLYPDKIILNAQNMENEVLLTEIKKLLATSSSRLTPELTRIKTQFKQLKVLLKKLNPKSELALDFSTYIFKPQDYLFNSTPLEIILRGDGQTLLKFLKDRTL